MEFLYRIVAARAAMLTEGPTADEATAAAAHFAYLQGLLADGTLILAGRTQTADAFGIVIFRAATPAAAQDIMERDPAVVAGVFRAELFPYSVALIERR